MGDLKLVLDVTTTFVKAVYDCKLLNYEKSYCMILICFAKHIFQEMFLCSLATSLLWFQLNVMNTLSCASGHC